MHHCCTEYVLFVNTFGGGGGLLPCCPSKWIIDNKLIPYCLTCSLTSVVSLNETCFSRGGLHAGFVTLG